MWTSALTWGRHGIQAVATLIFGAIVERAELDIMALALI
jgi:hypothetical protein